jgi:ketosteroid isomerase-like protein
MDDTQTLMIERACMRLITDYSHFVDSGEAARVADQFTEDGVWAWGKTILDGQAAVRRGFERRQANVGLISRHVCTNIKLDIVDADHVEGVTYLTLFRHDGEPGRATSPAEAPSMIGEYRDRFTRTADGWRFQRRDLFVEFMSPQEVAAGAEATK